MVNRAKEIVEALESQEKQEVNQAKIRTGSVADTFEADQFNFFSAADNPVIEELKELDLNMMTPVEALTKLFDLQAKAKNS